MSSYYVYYDQKTGQILSVTNEVNSKYEHGITVDFKDVEKLISGEWKFNDYKVGYKDTNDSSTLTILSRSDFYLDYSFKNKSIVWVPVTAEEADCMVEWDGPNECWNFYLSEDFKKTYNNNILTSQLTFFVTLETDFDFLIRPIFIMIEDIIKEDIISVPFESALERKIDKISISSKIVFKSYGLRIKHE
jgi:hypothetical protein